MTGEHRVANLEIRPDEKQVLIDGARVGLTVREFQLLSVLMDRPDRVMQRPEIFTAVWGSDMRRRDRSIDVLVRKVRSKLQRAAPEWEYIHTHFGVGYRFHPVFKGEVDGAQPPAGGEAGRVAGLGRRPPGLGRDPDERRAMAAG